MVNCLAGVAEYPGHHYNARPVKIGNHWKCSGCGHRSNTLSPGSSDDCRDIKLHIIMKQRWEKKWRICPNCQGTGVVKATMEKKVNCAK